MAQTLEQFAQACRKALLDQPGSDGRKKVCELVQNVLSDPEFLKTYITDDLPERKILYEDPELGFCILGHVNRGAKGSNPHDHGPSWAIYGQAEGETIMTDWALVAPPGETTPGKVRYVRDYSLRPGQAHFYDIGVLHSPRRDAATKLLRIEGTNMERVKRKAFEVA
ncbi:MAG: hypothetical protein EXR09_06105 [Acetobacteraceae bacterium]|nr:hypothetical protein [Acetobacteraceae bacterium]